MPKGGTRSPRGATGTAIPQQDVRGLAGRKSVRLRRKKSDRFPRFAVLRSTWRNPIFNSQFFFFNRGASYLCPMKFRTEIEILPYDRQLSYDDRLLALGSCFATEIGRRMAEAKFRIAVNR